MTIGFPEVFMVASLGGMVARFFSRFRRPPTATGSPYRIDFRLTPSLLVDEVKRADHLDTLGFKERAFRDAQPLGTYFDKHNTPVGNIYEEMKSDVTEARQRANETGSPIIFVEQLRMGADNPASPTLAGFQPVRFKNDEPSSLDEFEGQDHVTKTLKIKIAAMMPEQVSLDPMIFLGPPGLGKTTLAKIVTNELRIRNMEKGLPESDFIKVMGAQLDTEAALDAVIRRAAASRGSVIFIDEVHELKGPYVTKLYTLLTDEREYLFNGDREPTLLPDITFITATTDAGKLHPALLRRLEQFSFLPLSSAHLLGIVLARDPEIERSAAELIVSRTHWGGAPWEPLQVRLQAAEVSRARGRSTITTSDVQEVIQLHGYDNLGLTHLDRRVLNAMYSRKRYRNGKAGQPPEFVCYGDSEDVVTRLAGVDKELYRQQIKPRLMSRNLIYTRAGYGQTLTDEGIKHIEQARAA